MKLYHRLLFFLSVLISSAWLACNPQTSNNGERTFKLKPETPQLSAIKLVNEGADTSNFTLSINNYTLSDMKAMISSISEIYPDDTTGRMKAWKFVKDYTFFEEPLTDKNWIHSPEILINSLGFGYCDDKASALSYLWESMGYFSRVWNLSGHVVPEVFEGDTWKMYDPEYEVFYFNKDSTIAGVNDLMLDPYLVRFGFKYKQPCTNIHSLWNRFSLKTARAYGTANNNNISDWYSALLKEYQLTFTLPPQATLELPGRYEPFLINYIGDTISRYANARLTIPEGFSGKIDIPLVLHAVNGTGTLLIAEREYQIGSAELADLINSRDFFLYEFKLRDLSSSIEIIYLINPLLTQLTNENSVAIKGSNIAGITAEIHGLSENETVSKPTQFNFPEEIYNIEPYMRRLPKYSMVRIEREFDVYKKLMLLITSNRNLSSEEMTSRYELLSTKIESVLTGIKPGINLNELYSAFNDDSYFAVFISLIDHITEKELIDIINTSGNLKKHGKLHGPEPEL